MTPAGAMINGISNPARAVALMRKAIEVLQLNLSGMTVVTEAGSGAFALTPVLAAMAGAREVRALSRTSSWGTLEVVRDTVATMCRLAGTSGVEVTENREHAFSGAQLVTNLGFVRPIDEYAVRLVAPDSAVSLMCEAWEWRPGDVDLAACHARNIPVLATNEHDPQCNTFRFSGPLAGLVLFDAGFELLDLRVAIVGQDAFSGTIARWLERAGALVQASITGDTADTQPLLQDADVVLVCDYATDEMVVGPEGLVDPEMLAAVAPTATVVQFAGRIDPVAIDAAGLRHWPSAPVGARRMVRTFSALGVAPVITLHAGGLKVGELGVRASRVGGDLAAVEAQAAAYSTLVQVVRPTEGGPTLC